MSRPMKLRLVQTAAIASLLLAGCSSDGSGFKLAAGSGFGGGAGAPADTGAPSDQGGRPGGPVGVVDNGGVAPTGGGGAGGGGSAGGPGGPGGPVTPTTGDGSGFFSRILDSGESLLRTGNAFLDGTPLEDAGDGAADPVVDGARGPLGGLDGAINPLALISVSDRPVVGSGAGGGQQAVGLSALSNGQSTGALANLGLLANGQLVSAGAGGADPVAVPAPQQVEGLTNPVALALNGETVVGASGTNARFANAGLLGTDGKLLNASLTGDDLTTGGLGGLGTGGVLETANSVLAGVPVLGGVAGGLPTAGLTDTVNTALAGAPAIGGLTGGLTGGSNPLGGVTDTVNGALGGAGSVGVLNGGNIVTADISGLSGVTGSLPTGGLPSLPTGGLPDVGGLVGGVTGGLPTGGLLGN